MPERFDTDVFVVGGGPAGLAAALAATRRGFRVTVTDILQPPIDKACGEGLMPDSVAELSRLGVSLDGCEQAPFRGIRFIGPTTFVQSDFPRGHGIGVRRTTLHAWLIEHAMRAGIKLLWGVRVNGIQNGRVLVDGRAVTARFIIGADGQNSLVRSWAGLNHVREYERRIALRQHFKTKTLPESVEIHWGDDSQAYVTPVAPGEICVAVIARRKMENISAELDRIPTLRALLSDVRPNSAVRGALSLSSRLRRVTAGNVALVGDASGCVDAITGEGLALGFRQALALADAMAANNLSEYEQAHRTIERLPQFMRRAMLLMDKSTMLRRRTLSAFDARPELFARMLRMHVGDISPLHFGATSLATFGWQLLRA